MMRWSDIAQNRFAARIIKFFTTNTLLKIFALALTVLLFALAPKEKPEIKEFPNVPVRIHVSGKNMLVDDKGTFVRVVLRGTRIDPQLTPSDLKLELDTKDAVLSPDEKFFSWTLKKNDIGVPWGVSVESVRPGTLTLPVDTLGKRQVKVVPVFADELPAHLTLGRITVTPAEVMVEGPSSRLRAIRSIPTMPIQLRGINRSFDCDQELDKRSYKEFHFTPAKVVVQLEILPAIFERVFHKIPVRVLTAPDQAGRKFICRILSSSAVDVTLTGRKGVIESLRKEDFFPFVDISGFTRPGRYEMDIRCAFELSNVKVKNFYPKRVSVLLTEIPDPPKRSR